MGSRILDSILKQTISLVRSEFSSPHLLAHILHPPRPIPCFLPTWVYFLTCGSHTSLPSAVFSSSTAPCTPVFSSLQIVFSKSNARSLVFPLFRCLSLSMIPFPLFYIARLHEEITYIYPMHQLLFPPQAGLSSISIIKLFINKENTHCQQVYKYPAYESILIQFRHKMGCM